MAHDNKISANFSGEISDFFGWLPPHHLGNGVKAELPQSGDAFIKYLSEAIFHVNRCANERHLGQQ